MATLLASLRRKLHETFGENALQWYERSYALDWGVATVAWIVAWWIKLLPPYERDFEVNDLLISHTHRKNQISGNTNMLVALLVPGLMVIIIGTLRVSAMEIHHGLLSLWSGSGFTLLITEFLKNRVDFALTSFLVANGQIPRELVLGITYLVLDESKLTHSRRSLDKVTDGRRSFPSGHSSAAWAGMSFLSLYLAGVTGAWCLNRTTASRYLSNSRLARLCLTLAPIAWATWVAVSRVEDYRHHKDDVIVGSLIGMCTSAMCYHIYWPNPFTLHELHLDRGASRPRSVYREEGTTRTENGYGYELAGIEHAEETV